jgi:uncharacterized membrane protein
MTNQAQLLAILNDQQLLSSQPNLTEEAQSPWYIKLLLAIGGWLAALFFFGFFALGLLDLAEHTIVRSFISLGLLAGAYFILKAPKSEFFEHIGLAVSLTGQALLIWTLFEQLEVDDAFFWLVLTLLQMMLAWYMPSYLHRVFSAFAAAYAFSVFMAIIALPALFSSVIMMACAWLWLHEFQVKQYIQRLRAVAYGLTMALITIKSSNDLLWLWQAQKASADLSYLTQWFDEGLNCLVLLYVTWHLLKRYHFTISSSTAISALCATSLIGLVSMQAPGISAGMMLIVLSFAASHRVLMGIGVMTSLFYISKYYYSLELTLSEKSLSLALVGIVLLALSKVVTMWQSHEVQNHE